MSKQATIDNDFLGHLADTKGPVEEVCQLIERFFQCLDVAPELHELVCRHETSRDNPVILRLLNDRTVTIRPLADILTTHKGGGQFYEMLVQQIYRDMTGMDYPCDVFEGWVRQKSLGEVHCVVMCAFLGHVCFLSDDGGAKSLRTIVKEKMSQEIPIYSREDCKTYLRDHSEANALKSNEVHRLCGKRN